MACFVVPATEAVVTTVATKVIEKKEGHLATEDQRVMCSANLKKLNGFLWGGSGLLAFEHLWHGEIVPTVPFLTGAEDMPAMLQEMATSGVAMAALVTGVWAVWAVASTKLAKRLKSSEEV